jgi:hypothetical protein
MRARAGKRTRKIGRLRCFDDADAVFSMESSGRRTRSEQRMISIMK